MHKLDVDVSLAKTTIKSIIKQFELQNINTQHLVQLRNSSDEECFKWCLLDQQAKKQTMIIVSFFKTLQD